MLKMLKYLEIKKILRFGIVEFLDFVHLLAFRKNAVFRKLDLFPSSCQKNVEAPQLDRLKDVISIK
jgi:hypothetical protein